MTEQIFAPASKWTGGVEGITTSSRIRLARNLKDVPFPQRLDAPGAKEVLDRGEKAIAHLSKKSGHPYTFYRLMELNAQQRGILLEKHLISPPLVEAAIPTAVAVRDDEAVAVMFNEEDHLRIQCFLPNSQLDEAWRLANQTDDLLAEVLPFAFHDKLGYLTACPTNLGTGLRASVMMHLPALVMTKEAVSIFDSMPRLGLTVRGLYGERTQGLGNLFQISNQITLGQSESDIIERLHTVSAQVAEKEQQCRKALQKNYGTELYDKIWRAYGVLAYARLLSSEEMMEKLSQVWLGLDMGIVSGLTTQEVVELMLAGQPNFISYEKKLSPAQRDWERAALVRAKLQGIKEE